MPASRRKPLAAAFALILLGQVIPAAAGEDVVIRGEYLVRAGGCFSCHTAAGGKKLAGGRALVTPFGTFYSPNITPDRETGIGRWTDQQFLRALREGVRPDGANYFSVFPYPSFTGITDDDALAIKAYLFSVPPVHQENRPHDVPFPFSWRFLQTGWRLLFFTPGPFQPAADRSVAYNRGAYLVTALAHCGECHTPRNFLGGARSDQRLAGTPDGPDGQLVPNRVALEAAPAALITGSVADRGGRRMRALSARVSSLVASPAHGGAAARDRPRAPPRRPSIRGIRLSGKGFGRGPAIPRFFRIPAGPANKKSYAAVIAGTAASQSPSIAAGSIGSRSRSEQPREASNEIRLC
jgi:mono/diheme cytochrome c family protein